MVIFDLCTFSLLRVPSELTGIHLRHHGLQKAIRFTGNSYETTNVSSPNTNVGPWPSRQNVEYSDTHRNVHHLLSARDGSRTLFARTARPSIESCVLSKGRLSLDLELIAVGPETASIPEHA